MMADRYYGTGRRKNAIAKVWLISPGQGQITINARPMDEYVGRDTLGMLVREPLELTDTLGRFDVKASAVGGGVSGQAGAVRHGIARALVSYDENLRSPLRRSGLLTRDSRIKERKKYGRKRARRGFQWTKR
ncbi:MAG TPA: 30S ribosomal protein S9 [Armatimonadota bacterium]|jgi:small subunit ribosomal protein S9|nr:30S ribosomal protein S9 [Armatimonadota bacterium]